MIGVDYLSCAGPDGRGFVVSFIPLSTHKPHRAEWSKEPRQYYFRAGDDFLVADPAMLRMLFYPRYDHIIYINITLTFGMKQLSHGVGQGYLALEAFITNAGNASAYEPFVAITNNGADIFENVGRQWLRHADRWTPISSPPSRLQLVCHDPAHPGFSQRLVHSSEGNVPVDYAIPHNASSPIRPKFADIHLAFDVYTKDSSRKRFTVTFGQADLEKTDSCTKRAELASS